MKMCFAYCSATANHTMQKQCNSGLLQSLQAPMSTRLQIERGQIEIEKVLHESEEL